MRATRVAPPAYLHGYRYQQSNVRAARVARPLASRHGYQYPKANMLAEANKLNGLCQLTPTDRMGYAS